MTSPGLSRREARTKALELLFAADVRGQPFAVLLDDAEWVDDFTRLLVEAVIANKREIDGLIDELAEGWSLERMPHVDRNVLRLGIAELLHLEQQVPAKVAIDEAVELAKSLSTENSPRFVNGILAALARERGLL